MGRTAVLLRADCTGTGVGSLSLGHCPVHSITYADNYLLKFLVRVVILEVVGSESWGAQALYFCDLKVLMLGAYFFHGRVGQEILDVLVVAIRRTGRKDRHVRLQRSYLFFEGVPILLVLFLLNIYELLLRVTPSDLRAPTLNTFDQAMDLKHFS